MQSSDQSQGIISPRTHTQEEEKEAAPAAAAVVSPPCVTAATQENNGDQQEKEKENKNEEEDEEEAKPPHTEKQQQQRPAAAAVVPSPPTRKGGLRKPVNITTATNINDSSNSHNTPVSQSQLECLAAAAHLLGSPLQRRTGQPSTGGVQPSLLVAAELLRRGVDAERVVALVEARTNLAAVLLALNTDCGGEGNGNYCGDGF